MLDVTPVQGLEDAEARRRLAADGPNELPRSGHRSLVRIVLDVLREPMLALLLAGGGIYLLLGDVREAVILLLFAGMSVLITVIQEARTERVMEALHDLSSPRALVIRNGQRQRIAGREVVRGDIVVLVEGDRVPADARLLQVRDLRVDESLLTGESVPVRKAVIGAAARADLRPGGEDAPYVYASSLVVGGSGLGEVTATGAQTEIGKIGQVLDALDAQPPRLRAETRKLVKVAALAGGAISVLAVVLNGLSRGDWLNAGLAGIAIGMSLLPEEFPVVLAVFMAMGAWRISHARVLTRRATAIEALGSATVLCTDKTGTLTENRMTIAALYIPNGDVLPLEQQTPHALPQAGRDLVLCGLLASDPEPVDPMEKAFHACASAWLGDEMAQASHRWACLRTYGLQPDLLAVTQVWHPDGRDSACVVTTKGAPEAVVQLCGLEGDRRMAVEAAVGVLAAKGLRVLGVAEARCETAHLPATPRGFEFTFRGLVGLVDPLRASVPQAIQECRSAGIRVVMVTGDYPVTARAIASQAGLDASMVLTGKDLDLLDDAALTAALRDTSVFARILPEQKLRIVQALQTDGEVVAMTGDGVNDAPSLKAAHIGISMGGRGTDVAREASSIVLLDDDFGSIVKAVRLGRRIYDNLRKATGFIFAVHVPIAGLALLPLITGLPIVLGPIHIAFLEMIIDPVCSLAFEAEVEEDNVMERPPRSPAQPLFSRVLIGLSLLQGLGAFAVVGTVFVLAARSGMAEDEVRALAFFTLVSVIGALILVNRSFSASLMKALRRPNPALRWIFLAISGMLAMGLLTPSFSELFRFGPLHVNDIALVLGVGGFFWLLLELGKHVWYRCK
ncbi:cation-translocating P-type ATPase [Imbroritus primus]|uniref:cation-translocating P-type ATPase n=1 Tax=Imbroritus primus TaxID=3058603 RepID=UPI003D1603FC